MLSTSASLLNRLNAPASSAAAWSDFVDLYTPLLRLWTRRMGVPPDAAADLIQDVFVLLLRKLPEFRYDPGPEGSFRGWLRVVLTNKWRELRRRKAVPVDRSPAAADDLAAGDDIEILTEQEYRQTLMRQALLLMQREFQESTWRACWEHIIGGRPAAEVAAELNTTPGAVRVSSSRVLARLRQLMQGLLDY